jgi:pimeloyl-ACP methyl ester carboxylesterase
MRQAHVTLHGHRVAYRVAGDSGLPVLLLIHGITSSSATWDPVIPALAEHTHRRRCCWWPGRKPARRS